MTSRRRHLAAVVLAAGAVGAPAGAATARPASPSRLLVTSTEFRLALSRASLAHGAALVQLVNRGQDAHDLVARRLDRHGRETGARATLAAVPAAGVGVLRLSLRPGHYVLFCSLPGHRKRGMQARLRVAG